MSSIFPKYAKLIYIMQNGFELIVRALIIKDKKILVCQTEGRNYYFLPGGHVEFGETMHGALLRELREEMDARVTMSKFIGGVENLFKQEDLQKHEITFLYHVDIDLSEVNSKEGHIKFFWFSYDEFIEENIVPPALKDAIIAWTAEKETFFIEAGRNKY